MKIDFLREISYRNKEDGVVRISDFVESEATKLAAAISRLVESASVLDVSKLDFMEPANFSLSFQVGESDTGILEMAEDVLVCSLTRDGFTKMAELVKAFGSDRKPDSFQYLYDTDNPIELIMSCTGDW